MVRICTDDVQMWDYGVWLCGMLELRPTAFEIVLELLVSVPILDRHSTSRATLFTDSVTGLPRQLSKGRR